jgi:two-component system invasion response regulator UvrY
VVSATLRGDRNAPTVEAMTEGPVNDTQADVRVVTVDDQAAFRQAAASVIEAAPGFRLVGEAASGEEGLVTIERLRPDMALLDVRMRGLDGVETARCLAASRPEVLIVLISIDVSALPEPSGCGAATLVAKQDFSPSLLRELWSVHGPSAGWGGGGASP